MSLADQDAMTPSVRWKPRKYVGGATLKMNEIVVEIDESKTQKDPTTKVTSVKDQYLLIKVNTEPGTVAGLKVDKERNKRWKQTSKVAYCGGPENDASLGKAYKKDYATAAAADGTPLDDVSVWTNREAINKFGVYEYHAVFKIPATATNQWDFDLTATQTGADFATTFVDDEESRCCQCYMKIYFWQEYIADASTPAAVVATQITNLGLAVVKITKKPKEDEEFDTMILIPVAAGAGSVCVLCCLAMCCRMMMNRDSSGD